MHAPDVVNRVGPQARCRMTGDLSFWVLLAGLCAAMAVLMVCRAHWYALIDVMHRAPHDLLLRLDWPRQHPFDVPCAEGDCAARRFPVRRLRVRVMLFGLPQPDLCPPAALRHAQAFRAWGAVLLAALVTVSVVAVSAVMLGLAALLLAIEYGRTPGWPKEVSP